MSRHMLHGRTVALLFLASFILAAGAPGSATAQTGSVSGRVVLGKEPVANVNVVVLGTRLGAVTNDDGRYTIAGVPVGPHSLRVQLMGREPTTIPIDVNVGPNQAPLVNLAGNKDRVHAVDTLIVFGKSRINLHDSGTQHRIDRGKLDDPHMGSVEEVIKTIPGVVNTNGENHFRGGRAGEATTLVDGIEAVNPLFGNSATISTRSIAEIDVRTGGLDAEYGRALSGVISITTREGGDRFGGEAQWHTDRYGEAQKTFNNYDRLSVGVGGPTPIRNLTYFLTYEGVFSDTYLNAGRTQSTSQFFDFLRLGNRQSNEIDTNVKLAYTLTGSTKLTLEAINNHTINTPYNHMWSRKGSCR